MVLCYLEGQPVTQACAERWAQMGWVELFEIVETETYTEHHYLTIVTQ